MKLKIFLVFHQTLDQRLSLNTFSEREIKEFFIHYAVNKKKLNKKIISLDGHTANIDIEVLDSGASQSPDSALLKEYELPIYEDFFQERGFMETSCFIHILLNQLYEDVDYIGICQYDMRWTKKSGDLLKRLSNSKNDSQPVSLLKKLKRLLSFEYQPKTVYAQLAGTLIDRHGCFHVMAAAKHFNWDYLLESYNKFFQSNWRFEELKGQPLTLWQTYLMPKSLFCELASWLVTLSYDSASWANNPPYETHWGVLGGYTERAECLFMAIRSAAGEIKLKNLFLEHDESIPAKLNISKGHYG